MDTYKNCKTAHTGLYKPHTIYLNDSYGIYIVYWKRDPKTINDIVSIAYDVSGNKYDIYRTKTIYGSIGFLAFPADPDKVKGFYPYL